MAAGLNPTSGEDSPGGETGAESAGDNLHDLNRPPGVKSTGVDKDFIGPEDRGTASWELERQKIKELREERRRSQELYEKQTGMKDKPATATDIFGKSDPATGRLIPQTPAQ